MKKEVLRLEQVNLSDQNTTYLQDISMHICEGEIMGLLAVDSHGLTALMDVLINNPPIQRGYVYYRGKQVNSWRTVRANRRNRVGVVQRESSLVDDLTVAENIFVLRFGFRTMFVKNRVLRRQLRPFLEEIGVSIPADAYIDHLTLFERCIVELVKAVVNGCRLIVLRDVSTIVSETELLRLHRIIRHYAEKGFAFLYIGFHLEELQQICERIAVLDNTRVIKVLRPDEPLFHCADDYFQMAREHLLWEKAHTKKKALIFEAENLHCGIMSGLSFSVAAGECIVLQDLNNHIFPDLLAVLMGEKKAEKGVLRLSGASFIPRITRELAIMQVLPSESMLFPGLSYLDNLCFTLDHRIEELWKKKRVQRGLKKAHIEQFGDDLFDKRVENLTRAQQYDLIYRRILLQHPKIAFCMQPFLEADMALRMHIFDLLKELLHKGIAVVILAVNLADSLALADRLIRVQEDAPEEVYERKDFADLPFAAPFINLFQSAE